MTDNWFTSLQLDRLPLVLQAEQAIERDAAEHLAAVTAERDALQEKLGRRTAELALAFLLLPAAETKRFHEMRRALPGGEAKP